MHVITYLRAVHYHELTLEPAALQLFAHVIAYLRAVHYHEPEPALPKGAANLELLVREANFYALPGLAQAAQVLRRACMCCCSVVVYMLRIAGVVMPPKPWLCAWRKSASVIRSDAMCRT